MPPIRPTLCSVLLPQVVFVCGMVALLLLSGCQYTNPSVPTASARLRWSTLPDLPSLPCEQIQPGLGGALVGRIGGRVIVAGGSNFPDGAPWEGGPKIYYNQIYVLTQITDDWEWSVDAGHTLPGKLAYAGVVEVDEGLVLVGGLDDGKPTDAVWLMAPGSDSDFSFTALPPLPAALNKVGVVRVGDDILVIGGSSDTEKSTRRVYALDWSRRGARGFTWRELPALPGHPRMAPATAAQTRDGQPGVFVFSGNYVNTEGEIIPLKDAWFFDHAEQVWQRLPDIDIPDKSEGQTNYIPGGMGLSFSDDAVLVFSGSGSAYFRDRIAILNEARRLQAQATDEIDANTAQALSDRADTLLAQQSELQSVQPTFRRDIYRYDVVDGTWSLFGLIPESGTVTTRPIWLNGAIILPTGEIRPGIRTPRVLRAEIDTD